MSLNRFAKRTDTVQATIIKELRSVGVEVEIISKPVDIACRFKYWPNNVWVFIEIKTPTKSGKLPSLDKRKIAQNKFCDEHKVPKLMSSEQILLYMKGTIQ